MLTLKQSDYDKIVAHAKANLPEEACGLIAGTKERDRKGAGPVVWAAVRKGSKASGHIKTYQEVI